MEIWVTGKADLDKVQEGKGKDLYDATTVSTTAAPNPTPTIPTTTNLCFYYCYYLYLLIYGTVAESNYCIIAESKVQWWW